MYSEHNLRKWRLDIIIVVPSVLISLSVTWCTSVQVPLALIEGRVSYVLWPPSRISHVESRQPPGRILMQNPAALHDR